MRASKLERLVAAIFRAINRRRVWYRLPFSLSVANLVALRIDLRHRNVFDTETAPEATRRRHPTSTSVRTERRTAASTIWRSRGWG